MGTSGQNKAKNIPKAPFMGSLMAKNLSGHLLGASGQAHLLSRVISFGTNKKNQQSLWGGYWGFESVRQKSQWSGVRVPVKQSKCEQMRKYAALPIQKKAITKREGSGAIGLDLGRLSWAL